MALRPYNAIIRLLFLSLLVVSCDSIGSETDPVRDRNQMDNHRGLRDVRIDRSPAPSRPTSLRACGTEEYRGDGVGLGGGGRNTPAYPIM